MRGGGGQKYHNGSRSNALKSLLRLDYFNLLELDKHVSTESLLMLLVDLRYRTTVLGH